MGRIMQFRTVALLFVRVTRYEGKMQLFLTDFRSFHVRAVWPGIAKSV